MIGRILFPSVLAALGLCGRPATSAGPARPDERAPKAIYKQTLGGTAWVGAPSGKVTGKGKIDVSFGTAWVVNRPRKLLITSFHVVGTRDPLFLLFPSYEGKRLITERGFYLKRLSAGHYVRGRLLDVDPKRDLALIEAESLPPGTTELKLAAAAPEPGERVHVVGNPVKSKEQWLYTTGSVRRAYRIQDTILGPAATVDIDARVVETNLLLNPGDSGGPVVNDHGALVCIVTGRRNADAPTFCVAAEEVQAFLKDGEGALSPRTADDFNQRGARAYQKGLWARAVADFTVALRLSPKQALFYHNRAWAFQRQGKSAKAIADFTRAVRLKPNDATIYSDRGFANLDIGKLTEALADFEAAIRIDPKHALAYNNRAFVRFKNGDHAAAIADYSAAIKLGLKNARVYHDRGLAYLGKGDHAKAIADFTEAIRLQPQFADAYFHRGRAHAANKDPARAKKDHDKAIELNPGLAKQ
jgi:Tfp pilus assembly protein PilF